MTGFEIAGMEENMRGGSGFFTDAKNATGFCPEKRKILREWQEPDNAAVHGTKREGVANGKMADGRNLPLA